MRPVRILGAAATTEVQAPPARFGARELRRVTDLCRLALPTVEAALTEAGMEPEPTMGLVVGTGLADLGETAAFLDALHARGESFASPQAFQKSVHGALAGELAILYGLRGYDVTVTQGRRSGEAALLVAWLAVRTGRCDLCLCVAADRVTPVLREISPGATEGAATVLLGADGPGPELARVDPLAAPPHPCGAEGMLRLARAVRGEGPVPDGMVLVV